MWNFLIIGVEAKLYMIKYMDAECGIRNMILWMHNVGYANNFVGYTTWDKLCGIYSVGYTVWGIQYGLSYHKYHVG